MIAILASVIFCIDNAISGLERLMTISPPYSNIMSMAKIALPLRENTWRIFAFMRVRYSLYSMLMFITFHRCKEDFLDTFILQLFLSHMRNNSSVIHNIGAVPYRFDHINDMRGNQNGNPLLLQTYK